ncbi:hypothetical protein PBY51_011615 [Eleginops maclovinus]|uniref:Uncharacterized protein n=1 Tax=Eleginops maclovinus TaxID=56733 RepID=A0AAN7XUI3_ELEMC|nr:hypothetical protein PBY51_011615 [Eleginops maclovinus]
MNAPAPRRFALGRQPGQEAPLPHGSPVTSSRQLRSNHPKNEMMREGCCGGIIHATCCWYTTEAPPNPLPLCWSVHAPGGLAEPGGASSAGSRRAVLFLGCGRDAAAVVRMEIAGAAQHT